MSGNETTETDESEIENTTTQTSTSSSAETEATLDVEAAAEREEYIEELREQVDDQQSRIEELEDLVLDLSTRVASGDATGVCPDCHGPVVKVSPWFRSSKIKCSQCGRVFHEF
ncbi:MAG: hypothetical protein J07HQX50_01233 [Haloquadratum sp. J07HQX50]|jgi:hypothetical protein|nr:MAG: hypothetical protein J07HQX50_01233 [Haloquadratum sp. J07HQX50]